MRRTTRSSLARATLSDADAALEAATHAAEPRRVREDSDSDASEPATDGPDDGATDSRSVSLGVDEDGVWVGVLAGDGDFDDASDYDGESTTAVDDHLGGATTRLHLRSRGRFPSAPPETIGTQEPPSTTKSAACTCSPTANPSRASSGDLRALGQRPVGAASPGRRGVTWTSRRARPDASETSARGATLGRAWNMLFQVYSVTYTGRTRNSSRCASLPPASLSAAWNSSMVAIVALSQTRARVDPTRQTPMRIPRGATRTGIGVARA